MQKKSNPFSLVAGRFTLNILGSASAKPNLHRASSAQLLQAAERLFLIDCGEDTQRGILRQSAILKKWCQENGVQGIKRLSRSAIDAIFISHIHGDHVFGLFPLLSTMAMNGRTKELRVFGPNALGPVLTFYKSFWGDKNDFEIEFIPLKMKSPQTVYECPGLEVQAFPLKHGIDSYGFLFRETGSCQYKKEPYRPRSYAYCSDTAPFEDLAHWVKGVDLLYHEATYMPVDFRKAEFRFHSTLEDAARCAGEAGARRLLVGHYSSSIPEEEIHLSYESAVKQLFEAATAVDDGDIFDIPLQML